MQPKSVAQSPPITYNDDGSILETTLVSIVVAALCCLLRHTAKFPSWLPRLAVEIVLVWIVGCCLFNSTGAVYMGVLAISLVYLAFPSTTTSTLQRLPPLETDEHVDWRAIFAQCRGALIILTIMGILAADFDFFPKRFHKTEVFGISLMDTGVGSFALMAGLGASNAASKLHTWTTDGRIRCRRFVMPAVPLILLGGIRVWVLWYTGLKQHVTEYGKHWNFFFTLAAAPQLYFAVLVICGHITNILFGGSFRRRVEKSASGCAGRTTPTQQQQGMGVPPILVPVILLAAHEWLLHCYGWQDMILSTCRDNLFTANKEGTCTLLAYAAIFAMGVDVGWYLRRIQTASELRSLVGTISATGGVLFLVSCLVEVPSRRLANAPFVFHTLLLNSLTFLVVSWLLPPTPPRPPSGYSVSSSSSRSNSSIIMTLISKNELACFVAGNLLTGAINLGMSMGVLSWIEAQLVLLLYITFIVVFLHVLWAWDINLRLKL